MKTFFFFGDSLTLGVNDPEQLGWVGRLCAGSQLPVPPTTFYNLGARKHSSQAILQRWQPEVAARTLPESDVRLLFCFGTVDMAGTNETTVVPAALSAQNMATLLQKAGEQYGTSRIVVLSPFPVAEANHCRRIAEIGAAYQQAAQALHVEYIDIFAQLAANARYMADLADGVHPGTEGCKAISTELLRHPSVVAWMQP